MHCGGLSLGLGSERHLTQGVPGTAKLQHSRLGRTVSNPRASPPGPPGAPTTSTVTFRTAETQSAADTLALEAFGFQSAFALLSTEFRASGLMELGQGAKREEVLSAVRNLGECLAHARPLSKLQERLSLRRLLARLCRRADEGPSGIAWVTTSQLAVVKKTASARNSNQVSDPFAKCNALAQRHKTKGEGLGTVPETSISRSTACSSRSTLPIDRWAREIPWVPSDSEGTSSRSHPSQSSPRLLKAAKVASKPRGGASSAHVKSGKPQGPKLRLWGPPTSEGAWMQLTGPGPFGGSLAKSPSGCSRPQLCCE